ncbi:ATP synthase mitochondrial F1 complex assembly factor 1 [Dermatophagoides pteronyssinus]|uniref:ATP synthase mitochondrial F1 complex assembly factor 1 n=1 Tax=Dermatophagoides pteronyssinus TaxID=6956 RepID=UPI003F6637BD
MINRILLMKIMNRNLRNLQQTKSNVLPLYYSLAINPNNPVNKLSTETTCNVEQQQPHQSSKETKSIEENPYYSKYAEKIKKAQLQSSSSSVKNEADKIKPELKQSTTVEDEKLKSEIKTIKESVSKTANLNKSKNKLDDIVKLDLLMDKTKEEIIQIWNLYHSKRDCLFAIIESSLYETFHKNLTEYPTFILPLPRNSDDTSTSSYEFFLMQFQEHCCHFTPLAAYHLHKEMAPICLTIYYYPELSESKGIVLMMGEFDSNILNIIECQGLANQLQYYYLTEDPSAKLSLHLFNKEPKSFDHMRLIRHLEDGFISRQQQINLNQPD